MIAMADWNPKEVTFRINTNSQNKSRKHVYINKSSTENKLEIQLVSSEKASEYLRMPFPYSLPMNPTGGENERLSMEVAITDAAMGEKFKTMDQACIEFASANAVWCFGKELGPEAVKDRFTSPYKHIEEAGKNNLLRLKFSADKVKVWQFVGCDEATGRVSVRKGSVDLLERGCHISPKVEVNQLWFGAGEKAFGYSLQISDVIVDTADGAGGGGGNDKKLPFLMKEGFTLEVIPDEESTTAGAGAGAGAGDSLAIGTAAKRPTAMAGIDEAPAKRPNVMAGIDASLEGTTVTIDPNAYL